MRFGWGEDWKKRKLLKKAKQFQKFDWVGLGGMNDRKKWKCNKKGIVFKVRLDGMVDWNSESQTEQKKWKLCFG